MGILNDFERRLEGAIEGIFTKAFRTGMHPVELASRILKEMDAEKAIGVRRVWAPNDFTITLSQEDRDRFGQTEHALARELEQTVRQAAHERGWGLIGPPTVRFRTDPSLKRGAIRCDARLVEGPTEKTPEPEPPPPPAPEPEFQPGSAPEPRVEPARVIVVDATGERHSYELEKDRTIIGRLPESDVVVPDPGASRRHAEIRRQDGEWILADLGSMNGTSVNEAAITEHTLRDGDRITIGRTTLEFHGA